MAIDKAELRRVKSMVTKYGEATCIRAYNLYDDGAMGASGVGYMLDVNTNTADALISAGKILLARKKSLNK